MSHHDDNLYTILGRLAALQPKPEIKTSKEAAKKIYESVEARGSILSGVDTVQAKLAKQFAMERDESKLKKGHCSDCDCSPCRCKKCNECGVLESKCRCKPDMTEGAVKDSLYMELSRVARDKDYPKLSELMSDSGTVGRYLQQQIEEITSETGLHPDDDFEEIETQLMAQLMARLKRDFGDDDDMAEGWKQTLRKFDPTIKARILAKSQDQTNQGLDTIDQLTGMGLTSADMVGRAMNPNTYFRNAARYANLLAKEGVAEGDEDAVDINQLASQMKFLPTRKKILKYNFIPAGQQMTPLSYRLSDQDGELIKTITSTDTADKPETKNVALKGDVVMSGPSGEKYVVQGAKFGKLYDGNVGGIVYPEQGPRMVAAYTGKQVVNFTAPWGESMIMKPGDYLVKGDDGYYRVAEAEYKQTYNEPGQQGVAEGLGTSRDRLLARTGMNNAHKFPRDGQTNLGNIPGMNTPDASPETKAYADQQRAKRPGDLKAAIRGQLGKHHKPNLPEQGVAEGSSGKKQKIKELEQEIRKLEKQAQHLSFEPSQTDPETGHGYRPNYIETVEKIKELQAQLKSLKGVAEGAGDYMNRGAPMRGVGESPATPEQVAQMFQGKTGEQIAEEQFLDKATGDKIAAYVAQGPEGCKIVADYLRKMNNPRRTDAVYLEQGVAEVTGDSKFDNMMGDIVKGAVTPGKKVATKDKIGEDIWKMYELFYSYGDSGFDYLDKNTAYWDALFTKHNGDIDALINSESEEKLMIVLKELQDANRKYLDRRDNPLSELASSDNGGGIRIQATYLGKENFKVVINGESYLAIIENLEGNTLKGKSNTNAYKKGNTEYQSGNEHMWDWRIDAINITNNETGDKLDDDMTDVVADYIGEHHQADLIKIAIFQRAQTTSWHDQRTKDMGYIVQPTNKFNPDLKKKKPGVAEGETVVKGNVSTHKGTYGNEYQGDPDDDDGKPAPKAPKVSNSKTGKKGRPTKDEKDTLQAKLPWGGKPPKDTYKPDSKGHEHRMSDEPPKGSPERAAWDEKQARKNNRKPKSIKEEIDSVERRLTEGVNLLELLKEKHQTVDEMLAELSTDIANFKESGHCSELLKDCMEIKGAHRKAEPFTALDIAPAHAITPDATRLPHEFNSRPMEMDRELNELARLAGLSEDCGDMPPIGIAMQDMQSEQDNLSISTTYNSRDGKKTISVNADGKQAEDLLQMLRIAGLGSGEKAQELQARTEIEFDNIDGEVSTVPQDDLEELSNEQSPMILGGPGDAEMDEAEFDTPATEPVNGPKPEYQTMKQSTMGPGEGDPGEKAMHPDRATNNNGDNALSTPATPPTRAQKTLIAVSTLESKLAAEYESIKKSK